jgi:hypothetical protein
LEPLEDRVLPAFPSRLYLAMLAHQGSYTLLPGQLPQVALSSPAAGATARQNVTVSGQATDAFLNVAAVQAEVDKGGVFSVAFDGSGHFSFATHLALDGSADGAHTVYVWASDPAGNMTSASVSFTLDTNLVNQALTTNPGVQQNPSVAVDPTNGRHVVTAYLDYSLLHTGYAGIGIAVSYDNGTTWRYSSVPLPANFAQGASDPEAHFDAAGHLYVSFAAATFLGGLPPITDPGGGAPRALGFTANNGIFVARSDDGGMTWSQAVAVASNLYDGSHAVNFELKPDLAIDTFAKLPNGQPNPSYGNLYISWSRYFPSGQFPGQPNSTGGSDIMFAVSNDGGQTWQLLLEPEPGTGIPVSTLYSPIVYIGTDVLPGLGHRNWSHVSIGPEGDIYVSMYEGSFFTVYHSQNGGQSFRLPNRATNSGLPFGDARTTLAGASLANDNFRTQNVRAISADPARPGYVYATEGLQVNDAAGDTVDEGDIIFARSTDYGVTWQTTFLVSPYKAASVLNDDNFGHSSNGTPGNVAGGQALPRIVTDAQGNIGVIWYDTRRDPADKLLDVFGTVSTDGGNTFSAEWHFQGFINPLYGLRTLTPFP